MGKFSINYNWLVGDTWTRDKGSVLWYSPDPPPWKSQKYYVDNISPVPLSHPYIKQCLYMELPHPYPLREAIKTRVFPYPPWAFKCLALDYDFTYNSVLVKKETGTQVLSYEYREDGEIDIFRVMVLPLKQLSSADDGLFMKILPLPSWYDLKRNGLWETVDLPERVIYTA